MSEICILYCLSKREMTIYSVKKYISEFFGAYTKPSHGTIYPSLKRLLAEGCVTVHDVLSEGGKKSSYYSITDKGKKLFNKLMLSDFSDNPSVFFNEINIRISAISFLEKTNRLELIQNCIKIAELYICKTDRSLTDEYSGLDDYQREIIAHSKKQTIGLIDFLKSIKV